MTLRAGGNVVSLILEDPPPFAEPGGPPHRWFSMVQDMSQAYDLEHHRLVIGALQRPHHLCATDL